MRITKEELAILKREYAKGQKYGVHFICASLIIWIFILGVSFTGMSLYTRNVLSLYSSAMLVPLALLFSKLFKIRFSDKENPLNSAGIVFALNQMLYLLVVLLVWMIKPEQMLTAYAIVVGAHFLPYSWLYDSLIYRIAAIIIPVMAFALALMKLAAFVPLVMIVADIIMIVIFLSISRKSDNN